MMKNGPHATGSGQIHRLLQAGLLIVVEVDGIDMKKLSIICFVTADR
jgi:hypothetical protein